MPLERLKFKLLYLHQVEVMVFLGDHLRSGDLRQESILDIQPTDGDRLLDILNIRQGEEDTRLRGPGIRLIAFFLHQDGIRQLEAPGRILDPGVILIFFINLTGCVWEYFIFPQV